MSLILQLAKLGGKDLARFATYDSSDEETVKVHHYYKPDNNGGVVQFLLKEQKRKFVQLRTLQDKRLADGTREAESILLA